MSKQMTNYDRLYDMEHGGRFNPAPTVRGISLLVKRMRGTGVEPASPKAPDPKSDATGASTPVTEGASATQRHQSPPKTSQTTTDSTTDSKMSVSRCPAPAWGRR